MQSSIYERHLITYIRGGKASKRSFTVATSSITKEAWMREQEKHGDAKNQEERRFSLSLDLL